MADGEPYVYKLDDMSREETYMKSKFVAFFEDLGYIDNVVPSGETPRKQKKWFIETHILVEAA